MLSCSVQCGEHECEHVAFLYIVGGKYGQTHNGTHNGTSYKLVQYSIRYVHIYTLAVQTVICK